MGTTVRVFVLTALLSLIPVTAAETVTIFAASSTTEAVQTVARRYEAEHGVKVVCSFAASSTLAKQIENGAPADLFLSADQRRMDHLARLKAIDAASRSDLLGNALVLDRKSVV